MKRIGKIIAAVIGATAAAGIAVAGCGQPDRTFWLACRSGEGGERLIIWRLVIWRLDARASRRGFCNQCKVLRWGVPRGA